MGSTTTTFKGISRRPSFFDILRLVNTSHGSKKQVE